MRFFCTASKPKMSVYLGSASLLLSLSSFFIAAAEGFSENEQDIATQTAAVLGFVSIACFSFALGATCRGRADTFAQNNPGMTMC